MSDEQGNRLSSSPKADVRDGRHVMRAHVIPTVVILPSVYPQKLDYLGLSTFTPHASTPDFHQRGDQINAQDHYVVGQAGLLNSRFSYKRFDADVTVQSNDPSRLLLEPKAVSSIGRRVELPAPACRKLIS